MYHKQNFMKFVALYALAFVLVIAAYVVINEKTQLAPSTGGETISKSLDHAMTTIVPESKYNKPVK